jgi:hypothetical protein
MVFCRVAPMVATAPLHTMLKRTGQSQLNPGIFSHVRDGRGTPILTFKGNLREH